MAITLDAITLPEDLIWLDEYSWSKVTQDIKKSLTGALIIQEAVQAKGRTITLQGSQDSAWITKATLDLLQAKYDTADLQMTLTINGTPYNVMFLRSGNASPAETAQIFNLANPDDAHIYTVTLKFIEV